ncbi:MAG: sigma-70 family RNA polymerase sigma factor [Bacteroidales bacterium]|jgi:RNA polymerase sigma factor (sigma-70 family)|nr:sigma-70 family RNA polymerase sigma factor [Bacteroidales bacterium]
MSTTKLSDHELVKQFVNGKQSSIEVLINRHKDRIFSYIFLMVKNEHLANDIFQDTFIKVIKSLKKGKYQENGKFVSWVIRISHNLVIDYFRKENQLKVSSNDSMEYDLFNSKRFAEITVEDKIVKEQIENDLRNLLDLLPAEQKEVIVMRHYAGLSFKDIAEQTDVSINTALGRMRYALINLRRFIEEKNMNLTAV